MQTKLLKSVVENLINKQAIPIIDLLFDKKNVNEFLIAKKLDLTINQTRNILYKLSDYGLVSFIRKKDKRKGWYIYFWTLNVYQSLNFLKTSLINNVQELENQLKSRKEKRYYSCETCNLEVSEETALLNDFTCTECEQIYKLSDNQSYYSDLEKAIAALKKDIESVDLELEVEQGKIDKKQQRKIKKAESDKKAVREERKKIRDKLKKKDLPKKEIKKDKEKRQKRKLRNNSIMDKWFNGKLDEKNMKIVRSKSFNPLRSFFRVLSLTNWIVLINVIVFIITFILSLIFSEEIVLSYLAIQPFKIFHDYYFWTLITSVFVHGSVWHLLANMISLLFIGNFVERIIGRKRFFWLYIFAGIFAGIFYASLSYFFGYGFFQERIFSSPMTYAVGASGAIFSLLGLLAVLTPNNRVSLIAGPLIALIVDSVLNQLFPTSAIIPVISFLITIYIIISLFVMFSFNPKLVKIAIPLDMKFAILPIVAIVPLIVIGLFIPLPIGNTAHLGGLIAGVIYGFYLKRRYKKKTEMIKRVFSR